MQFIKVIGYVIGLALLALTTTAYGQTCNNATPSTTPDSRYHDNADGTVTDLYTSLMWQRCSAGQSSDDCTGGSGDIYTWDQALQYPQTLNSGIGYAGYTDWRLPNTKELESLVEEACYSPAINATYFPNTLTSSYWSSSPKAYNSDEAWYVDFGYGRTYYFNRGPFGNRVRLVRSSL